MARIVKEEEYTAKVNEILDAATRLIYTKGYERMTIQDFLDALQISKGAFYHYFDSKAAVLEAFIERIRVESETALLPIIHDPERSALEKLQGFFKAFDTIHLERKAEIAKLARIWYTDQNAIVRLKVEEAVIEQRGPLINEIVRQGIEEGVFTTAHPDQVGRVIMSLVQSMGNIHAKLLLAVERAPDPQPIVDQVVAVHWAYVDAIERVLGAPPKSLYRADAEAVQVWVSALQQGGS